MVEREQVNVDFGFAPPSVQQRDTSAPYLAPPAQKSALTIQMEGLAALSGTLLSAVNKYERNKLLKEEREKTLSAEDKKSLNALASDLSRAESDTQREEIKKAFFARQVASDPKKASMNMFLQDATEGYRAAQEIQMHFDEKLKDPEFQNVLYNPDTNIMELMNTELHNVTFTDSSYRSHPNAQGAFNSILAQTRGTVTQRHNARVQEDSKNMSIYSVSQTLGLGRSNGKSFGEIFKIKGDEIYSNWGIMGTEMLAEGALMQFNSYLENNQLVKARELFTDFKKYEFRAGRSLGSYEPETLSTMRTALTVAETSYQEELERKEKALPGEYTKQLNENMSAFVNERFNNPNFNWATANVDNMMLQWGSQFSLPAIALSRLGVTKDNSLKTIAEYDSKGVWEEAQDKMRTRLLTLVRAGDQTDVAFENDFVRNHLYTSSAKTLNDILDKQGDNFSSSDLIKYRGVAKSRVGIDAETKNFKTQYNTHESDYMSRYDTIVDAATFAQPRRKSRDRGFNSEENQLFLIFQKGKREVRNDYIVERGKLMEQVAKEKITIEKAYEDLNKWVDNRLSVDGFKLAYSKEEWFKEAYNFKIKDSATGFDFPVKKLFGELGK